MTLLGAYADSVRTVLFFHEEPSVGNVGLLGLFDDQGQLLAGSSSGPGLPGDYWVAVEAGLRAAPGTTAHGIAKVGALTTVQPGPPLRGTWGFDFLVPLQLSDELAPGRTDFQLGTWRVRIQSMTATPASFHLQALITGAAVGAFGHDGVALVDPTGVVLQPANVSSRVAAPKQAVKASNSQDTLLTVYWSRATAGGNYTLRLTGNGTSRDIQVLVPASAPGEAVGKVPPSASGSFPADLTISGPLSGHIGAVAVSLCAANGLGSNGGYGTVLRAPVGGGVVTIYVMVFQPRYSGPGTYPAYRDDLRVRDK